MDSITDVFLNKLFSSEADKLFFKQLVVIAFCRLLLR